MVRANENCSFSDDRDTIKHKRSIITSLFVASSQGGAETRFAAICDLSWSNFATSCSRPMKLLHYVSQAPHKNICNSIMHKDLQNAAISLNESNSWRRLAANRSV